MFVNYYLGADAAFRVGARPSAVGRPIEAGLPLPRSKRAPVRPVDKMPLPCARGAEDAMVGDAAFDVARVEKSIAGDAERRLPSPLGHGGAPALPAHHEEEDSAFTIALPADPLRLLHLPTRAELGHFWIIYDPSVERLSGAADAPSTSRALFGRGTFRCLDARRGACRSLSPMRALGRAAFSPRRWIL